MNKQKYILAGITSVIVVCVIAIVTIIAKSGAFLSFSHLFSYGGDDRALPHWTVHVMDVGQGDAIFVEFEDGTQILVDGGPDDAVLAELSAVMPPWDRTIDYIVATHPHVDHIGGLIDVLDRYDVANEVFAWVPYPSEAEDAFITAVANEGARVFDPNDLDRALDGTVKLDVIYPSPEIDIGHIDDVNEDSIVLQISDGAHSMLLMGDIGEMVETRLLKLGLVSDIDVLKVGHHGSKYSSSREFLEVADPEVALISAGIDNEYHHPHPTALKRLEFVGADIFRTDIDGMITVESYDDGLNIATERDTRSIFDYWMRAK